MDTLKITLFGLLLVAANAVAGERISAYVTDSDGAVVKTRFGLCVRTSQWSVETAIKECDPDLFPEKVAVTPPPEEKPVTPVPPPVVPPAPPSLQLSSGSLFDFDRSVVKAEDKKMLDKFVSDLNGKKYDSITVTGYTDRIGKDDYNMKLSERRANAVKNYLHDSGKIESDKIVAIGKGKSEPVMKSTDCRKMTAKQTIACLQPDRRVVVKVSATQK